MDRATVFSLWIDTPEDRSTVTASPVTVSGTVNKKGEVKINDVVVPVKDGKFSTEVKLTEGGNAINVVATSGKDTITKIVRVTYSPSQK